MERISRVEENRVLAVQYAYELAERFPFNSEIKQCATFGSAYFLSLEKEYMRVPAEFSFDILEKDIPEHHRPRLRKIWETLMTARRSWQRTALAVSKKWEEGMDSKILTGEDKASVKIELEERRAMIRKRFQKGFQMIQMDVPAIDQQVEGSLSPLEYWKENEKGLRWNFYHADKAYLLALRLYFEMLLEKPGDQNAEEADAPPPSCVQPILPFSHPKRQEIMLRNRYLRLIDAAHQVASIAKGAHHQQEKGRLRRTGNKAYWIHPLQVMGAYIVDVVPYVIEEPKLEVDLILGVTSNALHDIKEDTEERLEDIIDEFLAGRADMVDMSISPAIKGGFCKVKKEVRARHLTLIKPRIRQWLRGVLRVLSKNTVLTADERNKALRQNIAGTVQTLAILRKNKLMKSDALAEDADSSSANLYDSLDIDPHSIAPQPAKTFQLFPEEVDAKLEAFLVMLNAITRDDKRAIALTDKFEDRANNLETFLDTPLKEGKDRVKVGKTMFRGTFCRLIAWAVLDHDKKNFPLFNALPRLVDITLEKYRQFQNSLEENQRELKDEQYIKMLEEWSKDAVLVPRYTMPNQMQELHDLYYGKRGG